MEQLVKSAQNGLAFLADSFDTEDEIYYFLEAASRWASPVDMFKIRNELLSLVKINPDYNPDDPTDDPLIPKFSNGVIRAIFKAIDAPVPEKIIAQEVLQRKSILYNYNDSFYEFGQGRWYSIPDVKVFQYASDRLGIKASAGKCRNIVTHLKGMAGQWAEFDSQHVIAFTNGVLDLETGQFHKHSPEFMNTIILEYPYCATALCRKWRRFIEQVAKGNVALMKQLQKAAGYVLFADNSLQKMFALFGTGANGKSVYTGVLEAVFGSRNCSHVRPDRLSNEFDPIHMMGMLANFCYEAKPQMNGAEETLKAAISGDPITAAHKGVDAVSFTSRAKWFINLNNIMETADLSYGFLRRIIFLPFSETFTGEKANPDLMKELMEELPGIFNWAYEGYKMLRSDMKFEDLEEATKLMEQMVARVNNTFTFFCEAFRNNLTEYFTASESEEYPNDKTVYEAYKDWCKENNEKPTTKRDFLDRFRVFVQKYRPDAVISEPQKVDGIRGKVSTYYFPEILPVSQPDYFADRRDETGQFLDQSDPVSITPEEFAEEMSRVDVGRPDSPHTQIFGDAVEGAKIYDRCRHNPPENGNWWKDWREFGGFMTADAWGDLAAFMRANPLTPDDFGFWEHYEEWLRG